MVAQEQTPRLTFGEAFNEADRTVPVYNLKANWIYLAFCLALYAACFYPTLRGMPYDWAALYLAPIALIFVVGQNFGLVLNRIGRQYKEQLAQKVADRFSGRGVNIPDLLDRLWLANWRIKPQFGILYLILLVGSIGFHFWHEFRAVSLSQLVNFGAWLGFAGHVLLFLLGIVVALFGCLVALFCVSYEKISIQKLLMSTFGPQREMEEVDRNNLDIIKHDVTLKTMLRRVDTYTQESTLLGALAFSAFVQILVDSRAPIGDMRWVGSFALQSQTIILFDRSIVLPSVPNLVELTTAHIGSAIGVFLLSGTVSFLAVLAARIQFTDAYRHAEGLHAQAAMLNEKEDGLYKEKSPRAQFFTEQISRILPELDRATDKIRPIIAFMQLFRNTGLFLFLTAAAICGLTFSIYGMGIIVAVFVASILYFSFYRTVTLGDVTRRLGAMSWVLPGSARANLQAYDRERRAGAQRQ